jgi:hypothetical protein
MINVWAIGRNPKSWGEDAEIFKPKRFVETGSLDIKELTLHALPSYYIDELHFHKTWPLPITKEGG